MARAFGLPGRRVEDAGQLADALKEGLASSTGAVIDVVIGKEPIAPVRNFERVMDRTV